VKRTSMAVSIVLSLLLTGVAGAQQQERLVEQALESKRGPLAKLSPELVALHQRRVAARGAAAAPGVVQPPVQAGTTELRQAELAPLTADGRVIVDAVAEGDAGALLSDLQQLGFEATGLWGRVVSGRLPVDALDELAALGSLRFARAATARNNVGLVTSQGDEAMMADFVKNNYNVDGSGVTIGVLSDSFDCLAGAAGDVASGDLPAGIVVLNDTACPGSDEGRGMMQLVHDVAPGASQAFHTASLGQAAFAQGIFDLATLAGSDIIVDDILYFAEPMFQDGIVAQAVDAVRGGGTAYFSSAGNFGRDAWEDSFRDSGVTGVFGGTRHDFDPGPGVDDLQNFTLGTGVTIFTFQWDQPFFSVSGAPGSASDMDILLYIGGAFIGLGGASFNIGGDAIEVFGVANGGPPVTVQIGLELFDGPPPGLMKYVFFGPSASGVAEHATNSGTLYAHMNAAGAEAVGASAYFNTPVFNPGLPAAVINGFSSAGGTPILFDTAGNPTFDLRLKPQIVGPDGGNTTFFGGVDFEPDGFPNFFGTSASAPHAAAVAALMWDANPTLTPAQINSLLETTAHDMDDPSTPGFDTGFDFGTGFGFIDAQAAVFGAARDGRKIFVCHRGRNTLSVAVPALNAHLGHGDSIGLCN